MEKWALILLLKMMAYVVKKVGYGVPVASYEQAARLQVEAREMGELLRGDGTMAEFASRYPEYESHDPSGE